MLSGLSDNRLDLNIFARLIRCFWRIGFIGFFGSSVIGFFSPIALADSRYYGANLCHYEGFSCHHVKPGDTWAKLFPDEKTRDMVKRLNRTNLPLQYRQWIVVPEHANTLSLIDLSPFPDHMDAQNQTGQKTIYISLSLQAYGAYDADGNLVKWGPISAGKGFCPDVKGQCNTVLGEFKISAKHGPECVSDRFPVETNGGAPMPYCMYFYRGFALHGSTLPGYHASHGCVRLFFEDAEWLNKNFVRYGTRVVVSR